MATFSKYAVAAAVEAWHDAGYTAENRPDMDRVGTLIGNGVGGIDASDTTDLSAAKVLMMRPDDPKLYVLSMYWVPEAALQDESGYRKERDNVPYRLWAQKGYLRTIPGNIVPKSVFIEWFEEVKREYDVWLFGLGYDRWGFGDEDIQKFEQYVGKERSEVVRQGPMTFSSPMKELRAMYAANQVVDGHNPINEWCRMNVQIKQDYNANIRPVKAEGKAIHRIDGFMSELNGFIAMQRHLEEYKGII
jgi:phage terminase large subunit-like protein